MSLDLAALNAWLRAEGPSLQAIDSSEKLRGGQSNPTFLLRTAGPCYVLRRKPPGKLLKSAHAVDREYRVQAALHGTGVPVPRMLVFCDDPAVIGAEFYMMEHVSGEGFDDPRLEHVPKGKRLLYFRYMARVLATIHGVDLTRVGLEDYGRRGDYVRRQIDRWSRQYAATSTGPVPAMDRLERALDLACPPDDGRVSLVHGDFRIDNLLFEPGTPRVAAVLDWELSTLGHPFADLASVIMQWRMPPGEEGRGLAGVDRDEEGLISDADFVRCYCDAAGLEKVDNLDVYVAFCFFRMAAILQGVKKRALDGNASDPERGLRLGALVPRYAEAGLAALEGVELG
jgi:aminoglycoside phosphotransferase (APT) family kinase protein